MHEACPSKRLSRSGALLDKPALIAAMPIDGAGLLASYCT
ncbi:hypothetical protein J2S64_001839 [Paeniglutamicibacter sulfureus]|uniref:Uncharacterized protein n=1 Tax=Paeniglutamicibacter sulfureus TaxID=43666 RepID=A0ABU2BHL9_9MICC|nr:hypothetical protein [Paeniglutamicibacter sulfureus]